MPDMLDTLRTLRRPALLVSAARLGLADYRRERTLKRILCRPDVPPSRTALRALMVLEAELEATRSEGDARYSAARHVEVMIAIMTEIRLMQNETDRHVEDTQCAPPTATGCA